MTSISPGSSPSALRQSAYAGVLGSLGVMLAWLLWVAGQAFAQNALRVLIAPAIGATVGLILEFLVHHVRAAAREAREGPSAPPELSPEQKRRVREEPDYAGKGGTLALAFVFLYGVCQNLVGDLMSRLITPFLVTLAIFFPVGMWLGFVFRERAGQGVLGAWRLVGRGLFAGVGAAAIAFAVSVGLGLAPFDVDALLGFFGWWGLLAVGWSLMLGDADEPKPWAGVLGTLLAALLVSMSGAANTSQGVLALLRPVTDRLSGHVLAHPGLPARFWEQAVQEFARSEAGAAPAMPVPPPKAEPAPPPGTVTPTRPLLSRGAVPQDADPVAQRRRVLEREWSLGWGSGLVRSWLVMLLFSGAYGFARWLEQRLRPRQYEHSETRANDRRLLLGSFVLWLGAVVYVVVRGW